jgi:hypothetical protein
MIGAIVVWGAVSVPFAVWAGRRLQAGATTREANVRRARHAGDTTAPNGSHSDRDGRP